MPLYAAVTTFVAARLKDPVHHVRVADGADLSRLVPVKTLILLLFFGLADVLHHSLKVLDKRVRVVRNELILCGNEEVKVQGRYLLEEFFSEPLLGSKHVGNKVYALGRFLQVEPVKLKHAPKQRPHDVFGLEPRSSLKERKKKIKKRCGMKLGGNTH